MELHLKKILMPLFVILSFSVEAKRPAWLDKPYQSECKEARELCAVGEGQGVLSAEMNARAAIARMFKTRVESSTTVSTESSSSDSYDQGLAGEFEENVQQLVRQKTDYILEGAELLESYTGKESVFALVSLDKKQAAKTLTEQIEVLDTKNLELFKKKTRSSILQIEQNFRTRGELHKHYRFLTSQSYPSPLSYEKVMNLKSEILKKNVTILLDTSEKVPDEVVHEVASLLILHGYRVVEKEVKKHDYRVQLELDMKEKYLNVKGFEKHAVTLVLSAYSQDHEQLGQINISQIETGRNKAQILEKVLKNYSEEIKEKFYQLKLD